MTTPVGEFNFITRRHYADVIRISADSYDEPWTEDQLATLLKQRTIIGLVYEVNQQVVGYIIYELYKGSLTILNIAVDPRFRRKGIGTLLLNRLKEKLRVLGRQFLDIDSSETCLSAHLFLKYNGFKAVGINRQQYGDDCDGYTFRFNRVDREHEHPDYPSVG